MLTQAEPQQMDLGANQEDSHEAEGLLQKKIWLPKLVYDCRSGSCHITCCSLRHACTWGFPYAAGGDENQQNRQALAAWLDVPPILVDD